MTEKGTGMTGGRFFSFPFHPISIFDIRNPHALSRLSYFDIRYIPPLSGLNRTNLPLILYLYFDIRICLIRACIFSSLSICHLLFFSRVAHPFNKGQFLRGEYLINIEDDDESIIPFPHTPDKLCFELYSYPRCRFYLVRL